MENLKSIEVGASNAVKRLNKPVDIIKEQAKKKLSVIDIGHGFNHNYVIHGIDEFIESIKHLLK